MDGPVPSVRPIPLRLEAGLEKPLKAEARHEIMDLPGDLG